MSRLVLVVDDDEVTRGLLAEELARSGYRVLTASDGDAAFEAFVRQRPDAIVTDIRMPGSDGIELIRLIRSKARSWAPIIVVTSQRPDDIVAEVFQAGQGGATEVLHLHRDMERLAEVVGKALELSITNIRVQKENARYDLYRRALQNSDGVLQQIADELGNDRKTAYYHLKKYGLY